MYIHEILLALFGLLVVVTLCRKRTLWVAGAMLGLMFATKESFAISVIAWGMAGITVAWQFRESLRARAWREYLDEWWRPVAAMLVCAAVVSIVFYTDGLSRPLGIWDAVRTFFIYKTEGGHDKPFGYYLSMMLVPRKDAVWWGETTVAALALLAFVRSFSKSMSRDKAAVIRFLAYSAVAHFVIYSLIAYKTPWLMCLPWAHVCLLAGFSLVSITSWKTWPTAATMIFIVITLVLQFRQTRWATGRFEIDQRNAYAYVPTSRDIGSMERWLNQLAAGDPKRIEPIAVVGSYYWPLPWYLRDFDAVGYWQDFGSFSQQMRRRAGAPRRIGRGLCQTDKYAYRISKVVAHQCRGDSLPEK
jgi:predicted membrane-bound mannosyltransferase